MQILRALVYPTYRGWKNHPATKMWRGFTAGLVAYGLAMCSEWQWRGRADAVAASLLEFTGGQVPDPVALAREGRLPPWLGLAALHVSHRSSLVRKLPEHYLPYFPDVPDDLPYVWPTSVFPRWPVHRDAPVPFEQALTELGWTQPRSGQREAVDQLLAGQDVTLRWPPGAGATSTGLLAALCLPGATTWVSAHAGETDLTAPALDRLRRPPTAVKASKTSPSIARAPTPDDLSAVHDESRRATELRFYSETTWRRHRREASALPTGLVVADGVARAPRVPGAPALRIAADPG